MTERVLAVVPRAALRPEQGAAVLLPDGTSAAVFLLHDGSVRAVGNIDPFYGAPVMCHGIVGDRAGTPTVATPLGKQVFCLRTGRCLDDASVSLPVFPVSVSGATVSVGAGSVAGSAATGRGGGVMRLSTAGNNRETGTGQS